MMLKTFMKRYHLTCRQLASYLGLSFPTISAISRGAKKCSEETLDKLCEYFQMDVSCLRTGEGYVYAFVGERTQGKPKKEIPTWLFFKANEHGDVREVVEKKGIQRCIVGESAEMIEKYFDVTNMPYKELQRLIKKISESTEE